MGSAALVNVTVLNVPILMALLQNNDGIVVTIASVCLQGISVWILIQQSVVVEVNVDVKGVNAFLGSQENSALQ